MCHYRGLHVCNLYLSNFQTRGAVELLLCRATIMQAPVIIHSGFIRIVFMPTGMSFYLFTQEGNQAPLKLSIRTGTLMKRQNCILLLSEMLSETKGKRLGTIQCRGLKPPVVRGHAAAFNYWFSAFGHTGPYSQAVEVSTDWSQNVVAKRNPMNSPGKCSLGG